MNKRLMWVLVAGVLSVCGAARGATQIVTIFDFGFSPENPVINVGDTVRWVLENGVHTATAAPGMTEFWDSGFMLTPGSFYEHTFTNAGVFQYYCLPHGGYDPFSGSVFGMAGQITVVPEPGVGVGILALGMLLRRRR